VTSAVQIAFSRDVVVTAIRIAVVVGTLLALINQYDAIVAWDFTPKQILQILLTYTVPYCVSTYSSVKAILAGS